MSSYNGPSFYKNREEKNKRDHLFSRQEQKIAQRRKRHVLNSRSSTTAPGQPMTTNVERLKREKELSESYRQTRTSTPFKPKDLPSSETFHRYANNKRRERERLVIIRPYLNIPKDDLLLFEEYLDDLPNRSEIIEKKRGGLKRSLKSIIEDDRGAPFTRDSDENSSLFRDKL